MSVVCQSQTRADGSNHHCLSFVCELGSSPYCLTFLHSFVAVNISETYRNERFVSVGAERIRKHITSAQGVFGQSER